MYIYIRRVEVKFFVLLLMNNMTIFHKNLLGEGSVHALNMRYRPISFVIRKFVKSIKWSKVRRANH